MITLYMITHKDVDFIPEGRTPIFVGDGENKSNFIRDNSGDNIAEKNKNFCELTAYYWIWKNDHMSDYVSVEHYRRFLMSSHCVVPSIASARQIENELHKVDVITLNNSRFYTSVKEFYRDRHYVEDLVTVGQAIKELYPEYWVYFNNIMNRDYIPLCNIIAISKKNFDKYCQWLFDILFYAENKIDLSNRSDYQQRVFGFLAERLMEVWIEKNGLSIKRHDTYFVYSNKFRSIIISWRRRIHTVADFMSCR